MPDANSYTPEQFVAEWERAELKERASAQSHFEAVCRLVGHPLPHEKDGKGEFFTYEYGVQKTGGGQGFADVFYKGHFAIEYKGKGKYKDLTDAYQQLLRYRENLFNPPLLIVCDIANWEVHTNFPNTEKKVYRFTNADIVQPRIQRLLHNLFYNPDALHPDRNTEQVTADAAKVFERIAENMRGWQTDPDRIAHFLTKLVFCLFAEDVGLLPAMPNTPKGVFSTIVQQTSSSPTQFKHYLGDLFKAMADGGNVLMLTIPYFNGKLFEDVVVEDLSLEALTELAKASLLDWSAIEPAIFGTLFERSLDPSKRAQLGAHYTSKDDILLIVEPVLMQPLRREWEAIKTEAAAVRAAYDAAETPRAKLNRQNELLALREKMLNRLRTIKVLDPACGSGNFLYVALNLLLDMEKAVINDPLFAGMPLTFPEVHPRQLYGIELEPIAHALASIVVWIGYIQWRQNNGYMAFKEPILEPIGDNIRRMDAIMSLTPPPNPLPASGEGEQDARVVDLASGEGEQDARVVDLASGEGERDAQVVDLAGGEGERNAQIAGLVNEEAERNARMADLASGEGERNAQIAGLVNEEAERSARITDVASGEGELSPRGDDSSSVYGGGWEGVKHPTAPWHTPPDLWEKIKPLAKQMRREPTPAENHLWRQLRGKRLSGYKFRRQHTFDRFIVDFYCAEAKLVIEVDGPIHDYTEAEDALRQAYLESLGLRVLRFSNADVMTNVKGVLERIGEVLMTPPELTPPPNAAAGLTPPELTSPPNAAAGLTPPPNPLPASGEGEQDARVVNLTSGEGERDARVVNLTSGEGERDARMADLASGEGELTARMADLVSGEGEQSSRDADSSPVNGGGWEGVKVLPTNRPVITEPEWPTVDVIVGNPPFLGGNRIRSELGDTYVNALFKLYEGRVPAFADLVCYWFEKARAQIAAGKAKRAGLLSTNSIRGGVNREVLKRIKESGDIFMAWSDREWILDGAAVRVSMTGFDSGEEKEKKLDDKPVDTINSDLTASVDITIAKQLVQNLKICFIGTKKAGAFDIDADTAKKMLSASNANGRNNSDVLSPWINGEQIVKKLPQRWIINFGEMPQSEAMLYEQPFQHVREKVYPERQKNNEERARVKWWLHRRPAMEMKEFVSKLRRFIATPRVSKHRIFAWYPSNTTADDGVYIFAREDDYFFGVLHSKIHEVWSLRMGTWLGKGNDPRYTPTTTFETFPFPWPPGQEPHPLNPIPREMSTSLTERGNESISESALPPFTGEVGRGFKHYQAISAAAKQLHEERHTWLNPPNVSEKALKERTLTDLYNALNVFRGVEKIKVKPASGDFAPRLDTLHTTLDKAVCDAYGWPHEVLNDEEEILRRLLALNLERAGKG